MVTSDQRAAPTSDERYECIILGGGPAGLAAGVYLGRYRRRTLILNHKKPPSLWHRPTAHNVLGFPAGVQRNQLLEWGVAHVAKYESVAIRHATVIEIVVDGLGFSLVDSEGAVYRSTGLILAMGMEHRLPDIPDILAYAGHSVWHCPECDGYKCLGKEVAVIGHDRGSAEMALGILTWSKKVTLCTHGEALELDEESFKKLRAAGVVIAEQKISRIVGDPQEGILEGFEFTASPTISAQGAFVNPDPGPPHPLLGKLPLKLHNERWIIVNQRMRTNIPCCYAAGDIVAHAPTQLSVAMGTGATAAIGLHKELLPHHLCLSGHEW
jgi:thioredoxin reductase (NADPH)